MSKPEYAESYAVDIFDNNVQISPHTPIWLHIGRANIKYYYKERSVDVLTISKLIQYLSTKNSLEELTARFIERFRTNIENNNFTEPYEKWIDETVDALNNNEYWFEFCEDFTIDKSIPPKERFANVRSKLNEHNILVNHNAPMYNEL